MTRLQKILIFGKHAESDIKMEYAKMQELRQIELHVSPNFNTNL